MSALQGRRETWRIIRADTDGANVAGLELDLEIVLYSPGIEMPIIFNSPQSSNAEGRQGPPPIF